jgi:hypothetical protein
MRRYLAVLILLFIIGGFFTAVPVRAASAEVSLSLDAAQVTVGDVFFVYITIKSAKDFTDVEASLTYDDNLLEYQGGSSKVKGSGGFLSISDTGVVNGVTERKYTLKFEALQVGICDVSFRDSIMVYELETGDAMSFSSNSLSISAVAPATASTNAKLKKLQISPSKLSPEFNMDTYEYSADVSNDIEKLVIVALPEDDKSTVSITGNESLIVGENKIVITVLAESGDNIEYIINVNRIAAPEVTGPAISGIPEASLYGTFEVKRENGEKFAYFSGRYKLLEPGSDIIAPDGYIKTRLIISDISFTAYSPKDDLDSEFLLVYAENEEGVAGFYSYDRNEKTMQRYIANDRIVINNDENSDISEKLIASEEYRTNLTKAAIVIALLSSLSALLIIIIIRMMIKRKGYREDDLE